MLDKDKQNPVEHDGDDPWAAPQRPDFKVRVTFDGEGTIEPGRELIKRILPDGRGLLVFIAGQSQAGKSFVAVKASICLASGEPFFGFPVREKVGVIYVVAEGEGAIERRFRVAKQALGVSGNLPIAVLKIRPNIADKKQRVELIAEMKRVGAFMVKSGMCKRVGFVIIDTVAATVAMKDENSNAEISVICNHLIEIGKEMRCPVGPLIHMGKSDTSGIRGGSNWTGHGDVVLAVYADRDKTGKAENRRLAITKHRDGEEGPISGFELRFIEIGKHPIYGDPYGSCVIDPCDADWKAKANATGIASPAQLMFENSFNEIALRGTTPRRVHGDGPVVQAVHLDSVETEFKSRYVCEKGTPEQQQAARRKAWQRISKKMLSPGGGYAADVDKMGVQWVWPTRGTSET